MGWVDAGPAELQPREELRSIRHGDRYVAAAFVDGAWFAFADACTHHECPLADGVLESVTIECTCHGSIFDVRTGAVMRGPATEPIPVYPAEVRAGRVWMQVLAER